MVTQRIPPPRLFTPDEYLRLEREAEFKSEYLDGEIYAMSGGSSAHSVLTVNATGEVRTALKGRPCQPFSNDMKVETGPGGLYSYPDLTVVCGKPQYRDEHLDVLLNPTLIVEILSPTTEAFDRGMKWARYQQIESLREYLLVAQNAPRVELYTRQANDRWLLTIAKGLSAAIELSSIGCILSLSELYDRISFPPPDAEVNSEGNTGAR